MSANASAQTLAVAKTEVCNSLWAATTTYDVDNAISDNGRNYTAVVRSQGSVPAMRSGVGNGGQPWLAGATCKSPNGTNRVKQWSTLMIEGLSSLKNCDADVVKATSWTMK
ncbi:chemotaxis protein [Pandoraea capi]|uniref:Chemotaxis protein n=1 Tax=Pandoraea capi TaxID=2508286 RepID=A0ABY6VSW7_9BURK|nr:hypothetical protein [Pandoraea capi]VVD76474.1 chemotaxis protein [Pandoraea capi]